MVSRQSLQFMRFPGRAGEPESFTALPVGAVAGPLRLGWANYLRPNVNSRAFKTTRSRPSDCYRGINGVHMCN